MDDDCVHKKLPVPGMAVNSYFFSHHGTESADDSMSKCNEPEADMIFEFFRYLTQNDVEPEKITILTFYNGQRKLLERKIRKSSEFAGKRIIIVTVDSYQGEENDVILLSLVRNNVGASCCFPLRLETQLQTCPSEHFKTESDSSASGIPQYWLPKL